ncbi:hypothetical protein ENSA5_04000 [Enhygromyxa salina]|uniref:Uncharacterized protein n=2 Tax=Enhygromyxa salina TaxID=215803 RepID=A0A2S9YJM7_9BACT|nr:hypothetical protein ENSA5_04000 [Enhygromyxa salina]
MLFMNDGVYAADHADAPGSGADPAADIGDLYAWRTDSDTLVAVVTFAGLAEAGAPATYDAEVLYGIHIDNTGNGVANIDIWCRFGLNMAMEWGIQCLNVPGADGPVDGPVDTTNEGGNGTMVYAGPRENPFFFDFEGFDGTLMSGDLMFDPMNDTFAGTNVTAIVVEMDAAAAAGGGTTLEVWTSTGRLGAP